MTMTVDFVVYLFSSFLLEQLTMFRIRQDEKFRYYWKYINKGIYTIYGVEKHPLLPCTVIKTPQKVYEDIYRETGANLP